MKHFIITITVIFFSVCVKAQDSTDFLNGMFKTITYDRIIPPYELEISFDKTTHIIFPSAVKYVDLGSANLIAGKAGEAENVMRVKAAVRDFTPETNFSAICEDGSFYSFIVKYAAEPQMLNIEMKDFIHDGDVVNRPNNSLEIYLKELNNESPMMVRLIMKSIHATDRRHVKHIGSKRFGMQYLLKGVYVHSDLIYFHTQTRNYSNVPYDIDFIRFKIVDKKVAKRTAIQETMIYPVRSFNYMTNIGGRKRERTIYAFEKFTIPDDKVLVVEMFEKNGGRHQKFVVENADLVRAREVDELKVK